jgi:DNA-binding NtrC family response regulator
MASRNEHDACIFVIDDDASVRESLSHLVRSAGMTVKTFATAQEYLDTGIERHHHRGPRCLILDVHLPGLSGLDLQQELGKLDPCLPIIFITGRGDIPMTVRAMKAGAVEFLTKPFRDEHLLDAIEQGMNRAWQWRHLSSKAVGEKSPTEIEWRHNITPSSDIVGKSAALRHVLHAVAIVSPTESTVLIQGETGTGKELIARAIHKRSRRAARAFVTVNCAAIPPSLIASELFGHEKGAFTGALRRRIGRFELAEGGTIFLDEIGELPLETQSALLRVLQEREFERVGATNPIRADVRVIAATNRDLKAAMTNGTFRSDLYYRLQVFPIAIRPLRERKDDIPVLVQYFIDRYASKMGKQIRGVDQQSLNLLQCYLWPGNIRELQNVIERGVIVSEDDVFRIDERWLSAESGTAGPATGTLSKLPPDREKEIIEAALAEAHGRVSGPSGAARKLGIPSTTLESRIRSLKINKHRFKALDSFRSSLLRPFGPDSPDPSRLCIG